MLIGMPLVTSIWQFFLKNKTLVDVPFFFDFLAFECFGVGKLISWVHLWIKGGRGGFGDQVRVWFFHVNLQIFFIISK